MLCCIFRTCHISQLLQVGGREVGHVSVAAQNVLVDAVQVHAQVVDEFLCEVETHCVKTALQ